MRSRLSAPPVPKALRNGDRVGILVPSHAGHVADQTIEHRSAAFIPTVHTWDANGHGWAAHFSDQFNALVGDPDIRAIVIGETGNTRLALALPGLDWELVAANPKPIVGVGAGSVVPVAVTAVTGMITFSGSELASAVVPEPAGLLSDPTLRSVSLRGATVNKRGAFGVTVGPAGHVGALACTPYETPLGEDTIVVGAAVEVTALLDRLELNETRHHVRAAVRTDHIESASLIPIGCRVRTSDEALILEEPVVSYQQRG